MTENEFIFTPGLWLGEGKITFSNSYDFLKFYTKWQITQESPGVMIATQIVEMQGVEEHVVNIYRFSEIQPESFKVFLENNMMGSVTGKGIREKNLIAWEFRDSTTVEGFEVYERQEIGDYFIHAEFGGPHQFRTIVEGLIWYKEP